MPNDRESKSSNFRPPPPVSDFSRLQSDNGLFENPPKTVTANRKQMVKRFLDPSWNQSDINLHANVHKFIFNLTSVDGETNRNKVRTWLAARTPRRYLHSQQTYLIQRDGSNRLSNWKLYRSVSFLYLFSIVFSDEHPSCLGNPNREETRNVCTEIKSWLFGFDLPRCRNDAPYPA